MEEMCLSSWSDFLGVAEHIDVTPNIIGSSPYSFRGQSDKSWGLRPSLLRYLDNNLTIQEALDIEKVALTKFKEQAHLYLSPSEFATTTDSLSWLSVMQQHGAPTRTLDWTASIYVAAYFAVQGTPNKDSAIWIIHMHSLHKHMEANHEYSEVPSSENKILEHFFVADAPEIITFVERRNKSARMIAQQSGYSICWNILGDQNTIFQRVFSEKNKKLLFAKLIIPASQKPIFARRLRAMNITASTLFPGIDGIGRSIAELVNIAVLEKAVK